MNKQHYKNNKTATIRSKFQKKITIGSLTCQTANLQTIFIEPMFNRDCRVFNLVTL